MKRTFRQRLRIWWRANFLDYPYWRVLYKNGELTRLLHYREAKGCHDVWGGKLFIDYESAWL